MIKRSFFLLLLTIATFNSKGQSIDVATERFLNVKKLEIKSFGNNPSKKGYRAVYFFNEKGQVIKSHHFYKRKRLASYLYSYENNLLSQKTQSYSINGKDKRNTIKYTYEFDRAGRVTARREHFNQWISLIKYQDFNKDNVPSTIISNFNGRQWILKKRYTEQGIEEIKQKVVHDQTITLEENRYNEYGNIIYSHSFEMMDSNENYMIGGNRRAAIETYEYVYDNHNRWTEKYVLFENKRLLVEKRKYK